jgi:polyisoprenoid-binding protein YceI
MLALPQTSNPECDMRTIPMSIICWISLLVLLTVIAVASPDSAGNSSAEHCVCLSEQVAPEFNWTAFKFSEKTGVSGVFSDMQVKSRHDAHTLEDFIAAGEFTASVNSVATGNPIRDETLRKSFFSLFATDKLRGSVAHVEGDTFTLNIEMNGEKKPVKFEYKFSDDGTFRASSAFDMLEFGLKQAHESIHTACEKLHTGPDGVSKTWTEVELNIKATIKSDCGCS